jgi:hypothetical protein
VGLMMILDRRGQRSRTENRHEREH